MEIKNLDLNKLRQQLNSNYHWFVIAFLAGFVFFLSWMFFGNQSIRLDESQSIWQTSHDPYTILTIIGKDVHLPLYHLLLFSWQNFMGNSEKAVRMLSTLFFILTIPLIYLLGKYSYNRGIGLFATVLIAISPFMNWYANETRMYTLLTLATVLNQYFFIRILKKSDKLGYIGYLLSCIMGLYSHYFFVLNLLSQAVFYLLNRKLFNKERVTNIILTFLIGGLSLLPWLKFVYDLGSASNSQPLLRRPSSIDLANTFSQYIFGFQTDNLNSIILSLWPVLVIIAFLFLNSSVKKISPITVYYFIAAFLPITIVFFVSQLRPVYVSRYLSFTIPSLYLCFSWIISKFSQRFQFILKTTLITAMLLGLVIQITSFNTPVKEDYRDAANYIAANAKITDTVIISAPFTVYPIEYYYHGKANLNTLPIWDRNAGPSATIPTFSEQKLPEEVKTLTDSRQKAWVLLSYDQGYEEKVKQYFDNHYERVQERTFSPKLNLFVYNLPASYAKPNPVE